MWWIKRKEVETVGTLTSFTGCKVLVGVVIALVGDGNGLTCCVPGGKGVADWVVSVVVPPFAIEVSVVCERNWNIIFWIISLGHTTIYFMVRSHNL